MTNNKNESYALKAISRNAAKMRVYKKFLQGVAEMEKFHGAGVIEDLTDPHFTWTNISIIEADMFDINPRLNNALCVAYSRMEAMLNIALVDPFDDADAQDDRECFAEFLPDKWTLESPTFCPRKAAGLMSVSCKLPLYDCSGYVQMREAAMRRAGLVTALEYSGSQGEILH